MAERVLVSACLLGERVRYNGESLPAAELLQQWQQQGRLVVICPEVAGGLPVPRPPAEAQMDGRILTVSGVDVSAAFAAGATQAEALVRRHAIRIAILKARSPSCGSGEIYDGSFSGRRVAGDGVTAARLKALGVAVYNETQLEQAAALLQQLDQSAAGA